MSKVNFSKTEQPNTTEALKPAAEPTPEPVVEQTKTLVRMEPNNFMQDYIPSFAELRLPRVNIVQNIGDLKDSFEPGEIVYKQSAILYSPEIKDVKGTGPFNLVILCLLPRRWVERVEGGARGEIAYSLAEVKELGGTTVWKEWDLKKADGMRYFEPYAEFVCLIEKPTQLEKDEINFPFDVDGKSYALAIWGMKSSAFNNCAKTLFTDRVSGPTLKGYPTVVYAVSSKVKPFGAGKKAYIPVFEAVAKTTPAFQEFAHNLRVGTAEAEEAGEAEE
jgi:hypothetical protein